MIDLLLFTLAGCLLGVFTGLTPGIHVNTVSVFLLGLALAFNPYLIAVMIIAMAVTQPFFDFFPSILLGAPEPGTALGVLPGHRMLLEGRGVEAIYLTLVGGVGAVFLCMVLFPIFLILIPFLYQGIHSYIHWVLIAITIVMLLTEGSVRGGACALMVFLLSGALGLILLNSYLLPSNFLLFPVFTGLFGISTLAISLNRKAVIPEQRMDIPKTGARTALPGILKGLFSGALVGVLPAVGAAQATVLTQQITRRGDNREFLVSLGAINTITALFSLISLYSIGRARSGAALAVQEVLPSFGFNELVLLLAVALIATGFSALVILKIMGAVVHGMQRIEYRKLTVFIITFLAILVLLFTGLLGVFILFISTSIGLLAPLFGVKRSNLMGVLMVPLIIYYLGV